MEAAEQRHAFADLREGEDAGVEAVVEIGGQVGDFVGQIDELGFERRELVEEVFGQLGVGGGGVVVGVLDDAFADAKGQVEAAKAGIALLKPGDDAQGVQVVVEAQAVSRAGSGREPFRRRGRRADGRCRGPGPGPRPARRSGRGRAASGAGDLRHFQGMRQAAAEVVGEGVRRAGGRRPGFCRPGGERRGRAGCGRRRGQRECGRDGAARRGRDGRVRPPRGRQFPAGVWQASWF